MTGRLINADELKKSIIKKLGIANEEFLLESEKAVFEEIDKAPTVDAIPVEWIKKYAEEHRAYIHEFNNMLAEWAERKPDVRGQE